MTFNPGEFTVAINFSTLPDNVVEENEELTATLTTTNADVDVVNPLATILITYDDGRCSHNILSKF